MKKTKGIFISFEGPEASGKSTQILLLKNYLKLKKISYVITREPGGTEFAENLRKLILSNKTKINNLEEILLLIAGRSNHINNIILPSINKGKIVISDRFADSTLVYQGFVNKFGISRVKKLHKELLNNYQPDYTFIFKLSPKEIIKRLKNRKNKNKYDKNDINFHNNIIKGYKKISKNNSRFIQIDASLPKKTIQNIILEKLNI